MKTTTILTTAMAAFGLMIVPATAKNEQDKSGASTEATADNTVTVYIVNVKGKG